jgi:hypothetical protein
MMERATEAAVACMESGDDLPKGYKQTIDGIMARAKLWGIDPKDIIDQRTDAQMAAETAERLIENAEAIFEVAEPQAEALERIMRRAVELLQERIEAAREAQEEEADRLRGKAEAAERLLAMMGRVGRLRRWARDEVPADADHRRAHAWRASHPGRFAAWVFRSDLPGGTTPDAALLEIAPHHAKILYDLWVAEKRVKFYPKGSPHFPQGGPKYGVLNCKGLIVVTPPRHGKTVLGAAWLTLRICENPRLQCKLNHAVEDKALDNLAYVGSCFRGYGHKESTASGRRREALFPQHRLASKDNNTHKMRLHLPERTKNPTVTANGVTSGVGGSNADIQWWDDPVDPKAVHEETYRERNHHLLTQQWMTRFQGDHPFLLVTATLWHEDDTISRLVKLCESRSLPYAQSTQAVGGPNTKPPFFSLWDKYPPRRLREIYAAMEDPSGWAAQYMANPRPEELRVVKRLAFYLSGFGDCKSPTDCGGRSCGSCHHCLLRQHHEFVRNSEKHLSLDPAGTNTTKSDKAGLLWLGRGEIVHAESRDGVTVRNSVQRIRVLDAMEFNANQTECAAAAATFAAHHPVDYLHIETISGYRATYEIFKNQFPNVDRVICHSSHGNKNKVQRLKNVAGLVDDSFRDAGLNPPVVEFPGVLDEQGRIVCDPRYKWAADQILNAGVTGKDCILDALTQALQHLQSQVDAGAGVLTQQIAASQKERGFYGRPARFTERIGIQLRPPKRCAAAEEVAWLN